MTTENKTSDLNLQTQRFERKFYISPENLSFAYSLLRQVCRPDGQYPQGVINSLYFDTADLDQYTRSAAGEFKKDKVRIRWYDQVNHKEEIVPVYLELKSREGFASSKKRKKTTVGSKCLLPANLSARILNRQEFMDTISEFGYFPELPLRPVIMISYQRFRFNEMLTGTRVSFDRDIQSKMVTGEFGPDNSSQRISGGVIEVKGPTMELPPTLLHMKLLDVNWSRFSKYVSCIDSHLMHSNMSI